MSVMITIVAVALGIVPVNGDGPVNIAGQREASKIGRLSQSVDRKGNTHLTGFSALTGERFHILVEPDGDVTGEVGERTVTFHVDRPA